MLIFANGKAVFTGAKEAKDIKWALYQIYPVLSSKSIVHKKLESMLM
jgi:TATA-box binding protein (TBP) (component of TFIID and TFIIIB)